MKLADDWCYKPQRGQRNSTPRPRELRNMGRRLSNEIRPREMKVGMSGRDDGGASGWGSTNLESRDGWQGQAAEWGDKVWGVLERQRSWPWGPRGQIPWCVPGRTDYSRKSEANGVCSLGATQVALACWPVSAPGPPARLGSDFTATRCAYLHSSLRLKMPFWPEWLKLNKPKHIFKLCPKLLGTGYSKAEERTFPPIFSGFPFNKHGLEV